MSIIKLHNWTFGGQIREAVKKGKRTSSRETKRFNAERSDQQKCFESIWISFWHKSHHIKFSHSEIIHLVHGWARATSVKYFGAEMRLFFQASSLVVEHQGFWWRVKVYMIFTDVWWFEGNQDKSENYVFIIQATSKVQYKLNALKLGNRSSCSNTHLNTYWLTFSSLSFKFNISFEFKSWNMVNTKLIV